MATEMGRHQAREGGARGLNRGEMPPVPRRPASGGGGGGGSNSGGAPPARRGSGTKSRVTSLDSIQMDLDEYEKREREELQVWLIDSGEEGFSAAIEAVRRKSHSAAAATASRSAASVYSRQQPAAAPQLRPPPQASPRPSTASTHHDSTAQLKGPSRSLGSRIPQPKAVSRVNKGAEVVGGGGRNASPRSPIPSPDAGGGGRDQRVARSPATSGAKEITSKLRTEEGRIPSPRGLQKPMAKAANSPRFLAGSPRLQASAGVSSPRRVDLKQPPSHTRLKQCKGSHLSPRSKNPPQPAPGVEAVDASSDDDNGLGYQTPRGKRDDGSRDTIKSLPRYSKDHEVPIIPMSDSSMEESMYHSMDEPPSPKANRSGEVLKSRVPPLGPKHGSGQLPSSGFDAWSLLKDTGSSFLEGLKASGLLPDDSGRESTPPGHSRTGSWPALGVADGDMDIDLPMNATGTYLQNNTLFTAVEGGLPPSTPLMSPREDDKGGHPAFRLHSPYTPDQQSDQHTESQRMDAAKIAFDKLMASTQSMMDEVRSSDIDFEDSSDFRGFTVSQKRLSGGLLHLAPDRPGDGLEIGDAVRRESSGDGQNRSFGEGNQQFGAPAGTEKPGSSSPEKVSTSRLWRDSAEDRPTEDEAWEEENEQLTTELRKLLDKSASMCKEYSTTVDHVAAADDGAEENKLHRALAEYEPKDEKETVDGTARRVSTTAAAAVTVRAMVEYRGGEYDTSGEGGRSGMALTRRALEEASAWRAAAGRGLEDGYWAAREVSWPDAEAASYDDEWDSHDGSQSLATVVVNGAASSREEFRRAVRTHRSTGSTADTRNTGRTLSLIDMAESHRDAPDLIGTGAPYRRTDDEGSRVLDMLSAQAERHRHADILRKLETSVDNIHRSERVREKRLSEPSPGAARAVSLVGRPPVKFAEAVRIAVDTTSFHHQQKYSHPSIDASILDASPRKSPASSSKHSRSNDTARRHGCFFVRLLTCGCRSTPLDDTFDHEPAAIDLTT